MQIQVDIPFDQLVEIAKKLPVKEWDKLKEEVETKPANDAEREDFRNLLLNGPTLSKKQLKIIDETRKAINQWRIK